MIGDVTVKLAHICHVVEAIKHIDARLVVNLPWYGVGTPVTSRCRDLGTGVRSKLDEV